MENLKVELAVVEQTIEESKIQRGIFQGNTLSLQLQVCSGLQDLADFSSSVVLMGLILSLFASSSSDFSKDSDYNLYHCHSCSAAFSVLRQVLGSIIMAMMPLNIQRKSTRDCKLTKCYILICSIITTQ